MALELEFNVEAAKKAPQALDGLSPADINTWFSDIAKQAAANPRAVDALEEAFVKQLKSPAAYADLFTAAAVKLDKGQGSADDARRSLNTFMPGLSEAMVKARAAAYANVVKLKGADMVNPGLKYFADEAAKLTDADYGVFSKPLRVIAGALGKVNSAPLAAPKRKFVGS